MAVYQTSTHIWFRVLLTGAMLALLLSTGALAQNSSDDPLLLPQTPPPTESYSLPPGPNAQADQNVFQGPVDEDVPQIEPTIIVPRNSPANVPPPAPAPETSESTKMPAVAENRPSQAREPVRQVTIQSSATKSQSSPNASLSPRNQESPVLESREPSDTLSDTNLQPSESLEEPTQISANTTTNWLFWILAALLFVLLSATYLWRRWRHSMTQSIIIEPEITKPRQSGLKTKPPEPVQSAPAITLGFQPHSANATLINAVLGFELTLSNLGVELLTGLKVTGTMVQAKDNDARNPVLADLSPLREIQNLQIGETEKIIAEFRVPLATIQPILFQSQALFVPLIHLSIEFTDGSAFRHFQSATYLIGQEHEPPRAKMAPFRLDLGPCSFAPLGHRPIAIG